MEYKKLVHQWASAEIAKLQAELVRPLAVNDTVKIIGQFFTGQVGELKVIDDGNLPYGVYLDAAERIVFFPVDEIKRVEDMAVEEEQLPF